MKKNSLFKMLMLVLAMSLVFAACAPAQPQKKEEAPKDQPKAEQPKEEEKKEDKMEQQPKEEKKDDKAAEQPKEEEKKDAQGPAGVAGFEEFPIGDDIEVGEKEFGRDILNVKGVYFQPVEMFPTNLGLSPDKSNLHIEADISALEGNGLGFGAGDWVPFLTVHYEIINQETNEKTLEGTFMPMSASDGPHYGANIMLEKAGTYTVRFLIESPERLGYVLHVDKETGVEESKFWQEPIVAEWKDFQYVPREW